MICDSRAITPTIFHKLIGRVEPRGGVNQVQWAEQFWNDRPRKLDREIFEDCPSAKVGPLENFPL